MELDELKGAWAQYDKKLSENLRLNEDLLRSINFEKFNHALKKPMSLELLNIFTQIFMIGLVLVYTIRLSNEILYLLMGLTGVLMCVISLIFSVVIVARLNKLFYHHISITNFQKEITNLRILIKRFRKIGYVIAAIMGITLIPLMLKATAGIDLFEKYSILIPAISLVLGIAYAIGIWINIFVYDKGIRDATNFLSIIDKFEKEK